MERYRRKLINTLILSRFKKRIYLFSLSFLLISIVGCGKKKPLIYNFPVNSLNRVISKFNLKLDNEVSYDGLSSIRVDSKDTTTAYIFVLYDIPVKRAKLTWEAYCKSEDLKGKAFLEMGVQISKKYRKELESYLHQSKDFLRGTTNWQKIKVEFLVLENLKVDVVQLNLIIEGEGTVWIDQVRFTVLPIRK